MHLNTWPNSTIKRNYNDQKTIFTLKNLFQKYSNVKLFLFLFKIFNH